MPAPDRRRRRLLRSLGAGALALTAPGLLASCARSAAPPGSGAPRPVLLSRDLTMAPQAGARFPAVIDTATRLRARGAAFLKSRGVETVFRYYGHEPASLPDKHLGREERDLLFDAGLSVGVVFQHYNNCFRTFGNGWGPEDAAEALRRAESLEQPAGSAVYFGVDGDWPHAALLADILRYFEAVAVAFRDSGLVVGAYGNGCVLRLLRDRGLVQRFWLSGAIAHTGTQAFYNQGGWTLFQNAVDIRAGHAAAKGGLAVDTDLINPASDGDIGAFGRHGPAASSPDLTEALFSARAFAAEDTALRRAPDAGAAVVGRIAANGNLRVLARGADWAEVLGQEGGAKRGALAPRGFAPTASLASMAAFPDGEASYGPCGSSVEPGAALRQRSCDGAESRDR